MTSALQSALRRTLRRASLAGALASAAFVAPSAQTPPPAPAGAAGRAAARADRHPADSAGHLPGRDRVRRGRRGRHRRARQPGEGPHPRGFRGLRRRQVLQKVSFFSQVVIPVERLDRFVNESRPIVPDVRSNARPFEGRIYVLLLDNHHTAALRSALVKKAAHEFVDKYLGANDVAAVIHTSRRAPTRRRSSPTIRGCCTPRSTASSARSCARARWSASTSTTATRCCSRRRRRRRPDRPRRQGPRPARPRTRLLRQLDARHAAQPGRLHGVDPRPAQGDPDVQRGHRLSDPRRLRFARRLDGPERHA